jgi:hypothetical protein
MDQAWFEMSDIRRAKLATAVWIPLRAVQNIERTGKFGFVGFKEDFFGAGSVAVPVENKDAAMQLGWDSVGIAHNHAGYVEDGRYIQADVYVSHRGNFVGVNLVLDQRGSGGEQSEWHLHQDFVTTLGLKREGDIWVRPDEDYIEVARMIRASDGSKSRLEVRASHLRDYLCARGMGLIVTSYRDRSEIVQDASHILWPNDHVEDKSDHERWAGRKMAIHEGGEPYGEEMAVFHVARTDVNPEDDVPILGLPTDENLESSSWTRKFEGAKLYRIWGELWRTEWIDPASESPIVRGDKLASTVSFVIDAEGKKAAADTLVDSGRWLWFRPTVIPALMNRRGGSLKWYTRDTGAVACLSGYDVHFGVNSIGLVTVYAKDVALLPEWQQRIWAAHNVGPEGKISEELQASQVHARPARTKAPEDFIEKGLDRLQERAIAKLGVPILREHSYVRELIPRIHRFRATDREGLFALAKDVARITADDLDEKQLQTIVNPPKGEKWGSLKSLEKVLALKISADDARAMLRALAGIYDLRLADAHLPSEKTLDAIKLIGLDEAVPFVHQGYQLLDAAVSSLYRICGVIEKEW